MRKIVFNMFIIMILFICIMSLVSCKSISAQNININTAGGNNGGGQMMNNGPMVNVNQDTSKNPN